MNDPNKTIEVVAAVILRDGKLFATQRGYGEWKAASKREQSETCFDFAEREQARPKDKDWWDFQGERLNQGNCLKMP